MTKQTKQKGKITIANILAIVGIVMLTVFTFIGHSYLSGGELGWDIVTAVSVSAFVAVLLWFLIKAKGAENNLDKWRIAEYSVLAVYVLFAVPTSLFGGIMHFFVVNDNKEEIKGYAMSDLEKIDRLFVEYDDFEKDALSRTTIGLENAVAPGTSRDAKLREFFGANNINANSEGVSVFVDLQRGNIDVSSIKAEYEKKRADIKNAVNSWSVIQIPAKAKLIETLATEVEKALTQKSRDAKLPIVEEGSLKEMQSRGFNVDGGMSSLEFRRALQHTSGFSVTAVVIVLLIHLMILFNYFAAYRTATVGLGKNMEEDGGMILRI